jgi:uncharacterized protein YecE (DUF72 family)
VKLWVGTSGYSYKPWLGNFYPERLAAKEMLRFYASRLPSVEINNTFYRLPKESVLQSWSEQVPAEFRFVLKASKSSIYFASPMRWVRILAPCSSNSRQTCAKISIG